MPTTKQDIMTNSANKSETQAANAAEFQDAVKFTTRRKFDILRKRLKDFAVSQTAKSAFSAILLVLDDKDLKHTKVSYREIGAAIGADRRTAMRAMAELERAGWVTSRGKNRTANSWTIVGLHDGQPVAEPANRSRKGKAQSADKFDTRSKTIVANSKANGVIAGDNSDTSSGDKSDTRSGDKFDTDYTHIPISTHEDPRLSADPSGALIPPSSLGGERDSGSLIETGSSSDDAVVSASAERHGNIVPIRPRASAGAATGEGWKITPTFRTLTGPQGNQARRIGESFGLEGDTFLTVHREFVAASDQAGTKSENWNGLFSDFLRERRMSKTA